MDGDGWRWMVMDRNGWQWMAMDGDLFNVSFFFCVLCWCLSCSLCFWAGGLLQYPTVRLMLVLSRISIEKPKHMDTGVVGWTPTSCIHIMQRSGKPLLKIISIRHRHPASSPTKIMHPHPTSMHMCIIIRHCLHRGRRPTIRVII